MPVKAPGNSERRAIALLTLFQTYTRLFGPSDSVLWHTPHASDNLFHGSPGQAIFLRCCAFEVAPLFTGGIPDPASGQPNGLRCLACCSNAQNLSHMLWNSKCLGMPKCKPDFMSQLSRC
jgi:hypothetical protein